MEKTKIKPPAASEKKKREKRKTFSYVLLRCRSCLGVFLLLHLLEGVHGPVLELDFLGLGFVQKKKKGKESMKEREKR